MQLSELCGIITPPTNPFNPIITQQVNPFNPLNPLFTYRKQRCSPTDLTDFWVRRINNGFIGLNGFLGASSRGCTCLRSALPLARAISAPTEYMNAFCFVGAAETAAPPEECRLLCWCSGDRCTP